MAAYAFDTQLQRGLTGELKLDAYFAEWFAIVQSSADEQRRGMDRWFTGRKTGQRFPVEYKTDYRAAQTGNAFIETVSVDGTQAKVGDTVEWFRAQSLGPADGLLMVRAITRNGWIEGVYTRRSTFAPAHVFEETVLVDADRLRSPLKAEVTS